MKIPSAIWAMLAGIALTVVSYWYGRNHGLLPEAATQAAPMIDGLFNVMMMISTGLVLIIYGTILIAIVRFRRRPGDTTDGPPVHGNIPLEILWTAIPAVLVLGIAVYSFDVYMLEGGGVDPMNHGMNHGAPREGSYTEPPILRRRERAQNFLGGTAIAATLDAPVETAPADATRNATLQQEQLDDPATADVRRDDIPQRREAPGMGITSPQIGPTAGQSGEAEFVVNVTALQFAWLFSYPDANVTTGELHLPLNKEVRLNISANDVIHAFWVPEFRLKQDAIPGRQSELWITPTKAGTYPIVCAELCGPYHGAMRSQAIVQSEDEFADWLQSQKVAQQPDLNSAVAMSSDRSEHTLLQHHAHSMGITSNTLQQLSHHIQ